MITVADGSHGVLPHSEAYVATGGGVLLEVTWGERGREEGRGIEGGYRGRVRGRVS